MHCNSATSSIRICSSQANFTDVWLTLRSSSCIIPVAVERVLQLGERRCAQVRAIWMPRTCLKGNGDGAQLIFHRVLSAESTVANPTDLLQACAGRASIRVLESILPSITPSMQTIMTFNSSTSQLQHGHKSLDWIPHWAQTPGEGRCGLDWQWMDSPPTPSNVATSPMPSWSCDSMRKRGDVVREQLARQGRNVSDSVWFVGDSQVRELYVAVLQLLRPRCAWCRTRAADSVTSAYDIAISRVIADLASKKHDPVVHSPPTLPAYRFCGNSSTCVVALRTMLHDGCPHTAVLGIGLWDVYHASGVAWAHNATKLLQGFRGACPAASLLWLPIPSTFGMYPCRLRPRVRAFNEALQGTSHFAALRTTVLPWFEMTDSRPEKGDKTHFGFWRVAVRGMARQGSSITVSTALMVLEKLVSGRPEI